MWTDLVNVNLEHWDTHPLSLDPNLDQDMEEALSTANTSARDVNMNDKNEND